MSHIGTTASPTIRSWLKPSSRARRANFWLSLADETQKGESEQPFEALSWHGRRVWSISLVPRAHWKGFLKLSLVSCPVALYPAVAASERISFRQINKKTGNRLRQQLVDAVTGEPVRPIRP